MAVSERDRAEYQRNEDEVMQMREEAFILLGIDAEDALREEGFREWNRICGKGVMLTTVLSLLRPNENVFIMRRINQHKEEAIGSGRVRELQTLNKYVKMYGDCEVERLELTADDLTGEWATPDTPVLAITIRERED